ncbi:MAG: hypothetical protein E3J72_10850 [Planctomycetota bacterium]|nr:MAG: hypothetical protein E3J72_10850 [Planctomycetota bacterium]
MAKKKKRKTRVFKIPRLIQLDGAAFLALITAAAEVYKKECYGFLVGFRRKARIRIKAAIAVQTAERHFREVQIPWDRYRSIQRIMKDLPRRQVVGEFHSHPSWGTLRGVTKLSRWDLVDNEVGSVQIVIAVNDRRRKAPWRITKKGMITGILGNVHLQLKGYYIVATPEGKKKGVPVKLTCDLLKPRSTKS